MEYKNFNEAAGVGGTFFQVCFYDRREEYSGVKKTRYFSTEVEADNAIRDMESTNKDFFNLMLNVYGVYGINEDNYNDCNKWNWLLNKIDFDTLTELERHLFRYEESSVGYCFISKHQRNLEIEAEEEYQSMSEEDTNRSDGPYGGAFRDYDDYYNWKEGPGFFG